MTIFVIPLFEIIAAVFATIYFKKYSKSTERYFLYFLWFTFLTDTTGFFVGWFFKKDNTWIYIPFMLISFLFYFYWYYTIIKKKLFKKIITLLSLLFVIFAIKDMITESWNYYHISTFIVGAVIIVITSVFYFSELLNSNEVINIKHKLKFWIATGLLLFNVGSVPFMIFSKEFDANSNLRNIILVSLNMILFTCYSLGFIWAKKENNIND